MQKHAVESLNIWYYSMRTTGFSIVIKIFLFLIFSTVILSAADPFADLYQNQSKQIFEFEGTIRDISPIPDPQKNDYPDCLYSAMINVDSFSDQSGAKVARELIVNIPIMHNNAIYSCNIFRPGDKISAKCLEYLSLPESVKNIQVSDTFQSFEHDYFYAAEIKKISKFSNTGSKNFATKNF